MEKLKELLKKDLKEVIGRLKDASYKVGANIMFRAFPDFPRFEDENFPEAFGERIRELESIRENLLDLIEQKERIDRREFHRLKELEPKSKLLIGLYDMLCGGEFKLYKRFKLAHHEEKELLKKIIEEFDKERKIELDFLKLISRLDKVVYEYLDNFCVFFAKHEKEKELHMLLVSINEAHALAVRIHAAFKDVSAHYEQIWRDAKLLMVVFEWLVDEEGFIEHLERKGAKLDDKGKQLLFDILKTTKKTEKDIEAALKD